MKLNTLHQTLLSCMRLQPKPELGQVNWPILVEELEKCIEEYRTNLKAVKSFIEDMKVPQDQTQFIFLVSKTNRILKLLDSMLS